jgi:hypothetical protein
MTTKWQFTGFNLADYLLEPFLTETGLKLVTTIVVIDTV